MDIKDELKQIKRLDNEISSKLHLVDKLKARETSCTSQLSDMPRGTEYPDKKDITIKRILLEDKINKEIEQWLNRIREAKNKINSLEDTKQRTILTEYYLNNKTWENIAYEQNYCYMQIQRIHGKALNELRRKEEEQWNK